MTFLVSPGIQIREFDLTTTIPAVAATPAAFAGVFKWGPAMQRILLDSEDRLVMYFGKPANFNSETWMTASSFLAYGGMCYVVRALETAGNTVVIVGAVYQTDNNHIASANTKGIEVGMRLFYSNSTSFDASKMVAFSWLMSIRQLSQ